MKLFSISLGPYPNQVFKPLKMHYILINLRKFRDVKLIICAYHILHLIDMLNSYSINPGGPTKSKGPWRWNQGP